MSRNVKVTTDRVALVEGTFASEGFQVKPYRVMGGYRI